MRFKQYLTEKTFAIGADVDYIYKKFFKRFINNVSKGEIKNFPVIKFSSSELKSKKAQKAHKENPVTIYTGVFNTSAYIPFKSEIKLSLNGSVIDILKKHNIKEIEQMLGHDEFKRFMNELTPPTVKSTIYHELSHWISDTLYNKNITKRMGKAKEKNDYSLMLKFGETYFTDYELDAQVHAIKQLKRDYSKEWESLTWGDIITKKSSFHVVGKALKKAPKKAREDYRKRMIKRLNREKLLGKNMMNTFKDFYEV